MKRSRIIAMVLVMTMAFALFSGCKKAEPQTTTAAPQTGGTQSTEKTTPAPGLKIRTDLVIAKAADVVCPDPHEANDTSSSAALRMMYNSLLVRDVYDGTPGPALAESWEVIDDVTYRFKIRQGVKFHNGYDLTVEDVKFSLDRAREAARVKFLVEAISEVKIIDDTTVEVVTSYPYAPLLGNLCGHQISIISKKYYDELTAKGKEYKDAPIGTGPMKYKSWTPNNAFIVERWDGYWGEKAVATSVTLRVIPEESSRTIALQTGEVDMLDAVPAIDIDRVLADDKFFTQVQPSPAITYVSWNMTKKPYDDIRVRKAMSYLVDKQEIIDVVCEGKAVPINTAYSALVDAYDGELNLYAQDVEKAKALMVEAGYPDGFTARIALNSDERSRVAQVLQAQFAPIGINLEIDLMEWGAYLDHISQKSHEMFILGWSASYDPDGTVNALFHTDSGGPTGNRAWYSNPEVDALIQKGRSTIAWEEREPIYKQIQRQLMEDCVFIPIFSKETVVALDKNLKGIQISPTDSHVYVYGYVEK